MTLTDDEIIAIGERARSGGWRAMLMHKEDVFALCDAALRARAVAAALVEAGE